MANSKQKQTPGEIHKKKKKNQTNKQTNKPQIVYPGPAAGHAPHVNAFTSPKVLTTCHDNYSTGNFVKILIPITLLII